MLGIEDVHWQHSTVSVVGKGARPRTVPYAAKTAQALDRYVRIRKTHTYASSPVLWVGSRGPMMPNGLARRIVHVTRWCGDASRVPSLQPNWRLEKTRPGPPMTRRRAR